LATLPNNKAGRFEIMVASGMYEGSKKVINKREKMEKMMKIYVNFCTKIGFYPQLSCN
jgi:hypothetical protein